MPAPPRPIGSIALAIAAAEGEAQPAKRVAPKPPPRKPTGLLTGPEAAAAAAEAEAGAAPLAAPAAAQAAPAAEDVASQATPGSPQYVLALYKAAGVTEGDMRRRIEEQANRLLAARQRYPELFNLSLSNPNEYAMGDDRDLDGPLNVGALARVPLRSSRFDAWAEEIARGARVALEEGLTRVEEETGHMGETSVWWRCPHCDRDVAETQLESHVLSKNHQRAKGVQVHRQALEVAEQRGDLPDWLEVRSGVEYCKLCWAFADESHLWSHKHRQRMQYHEQQQQLGAIGFGDFAAGAASASSQLALYSPAASVVQGPPPIPTSWGEARFFEWKAEFGAYHCRLCWNYVDDNHLQGKNHRKRAARPEDYLGPERDPADELQDASRGPAPPPTRMRCQVAGVSAASGSGGYAWSAAAMAASSSASGAPGVEEDVMCLWGGEWHSCHTAWQVDSEGLVFVTWDDESTSWCKEENIRRPKAVAASTSRAPSHSVYTSATVPAAAAATAAAPEAPRPLWRKIFDPARRRHFFHCVATGESRWKEPEDADIEEAMEDC